MVSADYSTRIALPLPNKPLDLFGSIAANHRAPDHASLDNECVGQQRSVITLLQGLRNVQTARNLRKVAISLYIVKFLPVCLHAIENESEAGCLPGTLVPESMLAMKSSGSRSFPRALVALQSN